MKRSEMAELMAKNWMGMFDGVELDPLYDQVYNNMSSLLGLLENAGMVPPIIEEESWKILPSGEMTYAVHYWEEE